MHVLRDFFVAAVEESDIRFRLGDDFAVELDDESQHAMSGRMRRADVQHHLLANHILRAGLIRLACRRSTRRHVRSLEFSRRDRHV